jgi:hypothetical protein
MEKEEYTGPELIKPGWYKDLSNERYHKSAGISSTGVKKLVEKTPAHFLEDKKKPQKFSQAIFNGSAFHCLTLEPEKFDAEYVKLDDGIPRPTPDNYKSHEKGTARKSTLEKIERWEYFMEGVGDRQLITVAEYDRSSRMADSARNHPMIGLLLEDAIVEQSIYWWYQDDRYEDPEKLFINKRIDTAVDVEKQKYRTMAKVRPDILSPTYGACMDLKSSAEGSWTGFQKAIMKYYYHLSAAMYLDGINQNKDVLEMMKVDRVEKFFFLVVENEPPYLASWYPLDPDFLDIGSILYRRAMRDYQIGKDNDFPGYPEEGRAISPPGYARNNWVV